MPSPATSQAPPLKHGGEPRRYQERNARSLKKLETRWRAALHDVAELQLRAQALEGRLGRDLREREQQRLVAQAQLADLVEDFDAAVDLVRVGRDAAQAQRGWFSTLSMRMRRQRMKRLLLRMGRWRRPSPSSRRPMRCWSSF